LRPGAAALLAFVVGGGVCGLLLSGKARHHWRIRQDLAWTEGVVTARTPEDHDSLTVAYVVENVRHSLHPSFVGPATSLMRPQRGPVPGARRTTANRVVFSPSSSMSWASTASP
jgi:hypothetical protein